MYVLTTLLTILLWQSCECFPQHMCEKLPHDYFCRCDPGFSRNYTTGKCEDIDECASNELNNCSQQCLNNPGSYVCGCYLPGDQLAQDSVSCVGGCSNYTMLDDVSRDVKKSRNAWRCDKHITPGWYRFLLNGTNAVMPTECVHGNRCGTHATYWLDLQGGELPEVGNETVARVCASTGGPCYNGPISVAVRNCGAFYLYKLRPVLWCTAGYCVKEMEDEGVKTIQQT